MRCLFGGGNGYQVLPKFDVQEVQTSPYGTPHSSRSWNGGLDARPLALSTSRDAVLHFLLEGSESDVSWVLNGLARARPRLLEEAIPNRAGHYDAEFESLDTGGAPRPVVGCDVDAGTGGATSSPTEPPTRSVSRRDQPRDRTYSVPALPIVQFSSFMYYCNEDENEMVLDVIRAGSLDHPSEVRYSTRTDNRKAAAKIKASTGTLKFQPGEFMKEVRVGLVSDGGAFSAAVEFVVELLEDGLVNGVLGRYLWHARVKLIDNDTFPTSRYKTEIENREYDDINHLVILLDYFRMNFANPDVKYGSIKRLLADQLHILYFITHLFLQVYLVDYILKLSRSEDELLFTNSREASLVLFVAVMVTPFGVIHHIDYKKHTWSVGGKSRSFLQKTLITKFLHYHENSRSLVRQSDLIMAVQRDAYDLVHSGYNVCFRIASSIMELVAIFLFQLSSPFLFNRPFRIAAFLPSVVCPLAMLLFLAMRYHKTTGCLNAWKESENRMVDQVTETGNNFRMIADYSRRPNFVDRNTKAISEFGAARRSAVLVLVNNTYFMKWVTLVLVSAFTLIGGRMVIEGEMSLGIFLTTIKIFEQVGNAWGKIYADILVLQNVFPSLMRIVMMVNLPTDLSHRMAMSRERRKKSVAFRQEFMRSPPFGGHGKLPLDYMTLSMKNIDVTWTAHHLVDKDSSDTNPMKYHRPVSLRGTLEISQGQMVAFAGRPGEGKATLLKMLAGVVLPHAEAEDGMVFVPSHLRVLHLSPQPAFFRGTLLENLVFGAEPGDRDGEVTRVLSICRRLGIQDDVLAFISQGAVLAWLDVLSSSQRSLLAIARAFISNPEVLCIHLPTQPFSHYKGLVVMDCLREFVDSKGLEQGQEHFEFRRPRTCVLTCCKDVGLDLCNQVFRVCNDTGIQLLENHETHELIFAKDKVRGVLNGAPSTTSQGT